ncbi:hypothetical protein [Kribbella catacumbae]|uniref:hypothetical protein n=1 Tax=Kribbella catacumbae TaxID=460086 RepID=UPI00037DB4C6|nr:hypothetical protein [Kribbella catacumbae]
MARFDVGVRLRCGFPPSASELHKMRRAARRLPRPLRLHSVLFFVEGDVEVVLRIHGPTPAMAVQQARLALPMLGLRRDAVRRIDVIRVHLLRSHRAVLATWLPPSRDRNCPPPPPYSTADSA